MNKPLLLLDSTFLFYCIEIPSRFGGFLLWWYMFMRWVEKCGEAEQKMTMQKWTPFPLCRPLCDAVPVGWWRQRVWRWRTCCRELRWAAANVIINRAAPGNGQQHATWWLTDTAMLLAAAFRCEPIKTRATVKATEWWSGRSNLTLLFKTQSYVLLFCTILLMLKWHDVAITYVCVGGGDYGGKQQVQDATCWPIWKYTEIKSELCYFWCFQINMHFLYGKWGQMKKQ